MITDRRSCQIGKALTVAEEEAAIVVDEDFEVPEDIEGILEDIFPAIQDRVRHRLSHSLHSLTHTSRILSSVGRLPKRLRVSQSDCRRSS